MNIPIFLSVCSLLIAKIMLLAKILWTRDCSGISVKTQVLYAIIFLGRYFDLITTIYTYPLTISLTRMALIAITYYTVLSIYLFYSETYQSNHDNFRIILLILPCLVLSFLYHCYNDNCITKILLAFSIYLESVAIIPQLFLISSIKHIEPIVYKYICVLSAYVVFHLMDLVYRFYENQSYDQIYMAGRIIQLIFYCDFFMKYKSLKGETETSNLFTIIGNKNFSDNDKYSKEEEAARSAVVQPPPILENDLFHKNLQEVLLIPNSLIKDEKATIITLNDKEEKETNDSSVRV